VEDVCPSLGDPLQTNADQDVFGDACDLCPMDGDNDSDNDGFCVGTAFNPPQLGGGDICSRPGGAGAWSKPTALFGNLDLPDGSNKMRLKGLFTVGSTIPALAPHIHGIQVRVTDRFGTMIVDEHIEGGTYSTTTLRGWKAVGDPPATWKYLDKNKPAGHNGISKVLIGNRLGVLRVIVSAQKGGTYLLAPGQEPLMIAVELNDTALPPGGRRGIDECGEHQFALPPAEPSCRFIGTNKLSCK
jgi:hypothetical protein